jgi:hypothetical protein
MMNDDKNGVNNAYNIILENLTEAGAGEFEYSLETNLVSQTAQDLLADNGLSVEGRRDYINSIYESENNLEISREDFSALVLEYLTYIDNSQSRSNSDAMELDVNDSNSWARDEVFLNRDLLDMILNNIDLGLIDDNDIVNKKDNVTESYKNFSSFFRDYFLTEYIIRQHRDAGQDRVENNLRSSFEELLNIAADDRPLRPVSPVNPGNEHHLIPTIDRGTLPPLVTRASCVRDVRTPQRREVGSLFAGIRLDRTLLQRAKRILGEYASQNVIDADINFPPALPVKRTVYDLELETRNDAAKRVRNENLSPQRPSNFAASGGVPVTPQRPSNFAASGGVPATPERTSSFAAAGGVPVTPERTWQERSQTPPAQNNEYQTPPSSPRI